MSISVTNGTVHERIAAIAARQHGRVARRQLLAAGISPRTIDRLLTRGVLWPVYPGVYAVGHPGSTAFADLASALLAVRPGAALSHGTALCRWGLAPSWRAGPVAPAAARTVHLTLPGNRARGPAGIHVHRSTILTPRDLRLDAGLPVTSPARTLLDCAPKLAPRELERALDTGLVERTVTVREIRELLSRAGRHAGRDALSALLDAFTATTFTRSEAEERFLELVRAADQDQPLVNARRHGFELDFLWPDAGYAVEVDGRAFHSTPLRRARDARRDETLAARGIVVDRFTWTDLTGIPLAVAAQVAGRLAALRAGGRDR